MLVRVLILCETNSIIVFESQPEITCSSSNLPVWWMRIVIAGDGKLREGLLALKYMLINQAYKLLELTRHISTEQYISCDIVASRLMFQLIYCNWYSLVVKARVIFVELCNKSLLSSHQHLAYSSGLLKGKTTSQILPVFYITCLKWFSVYFLRLYDCG